MADGHFKKRVYHVEDFTFYVQDPLPKDLRGRFGSTGTTDLRAQDGPDFTWEEAREVETDSPKNQDPTSHVVASNFKDATQKLRRVLRKKPTIADCTLSVGGSTDEPAVEGRASLCRCFAGKWWSVTVRPKRRDRTKMGHYKDYIRGGEPLSKLKTSQLRSWYDRKDSGKPNYFQFL